MLSRRTLLRGGVAAGGVLAMPAILRAQSPEPVRLGIVHPVEGFFGYAGRQSRQGAELAVNDINGSGGILTLEGAKLEPVFVDAPVVPEQVMPLIDNLAEQGVTALVGAYASTITLAVTQAASRHGMAVAVDVAISDRVVQRDLPNVFRLGAGYSILADGLASQLGALAQRSSDPINRAMIAHVDAPYGVGVVRRMRQLLEEQQIEIVAVQAQSAGLDDYTRFVRTVENERPGILIPALYYADFANLMRALDGVAARPRIIAGLHGGPASSPLFLKEFPGLSEGVVDSTHWYNPASQVQRRRKDQAETAEIDYGHEVFMAANATYLMADSIARAASRERDAVQAAMLGSTFSGHGMPFGPTRFVNGQNEGAAAALTQIQDDVIRLIAPQAFSDADLVLGPPPPPPELPEEWDPEADEDAGSGDQAAAGISTSDTPEATGTPADARDAGPLPELPPATEVPSRN